VASAFSCQLRNSCPGLWLPWRPHCGGHATYPSTTSQQPTANNQQAKLTATYVAPCHVDAAANADVNTDANVDVNVDVPRLVCL